MCTQTSFMCTRISVTHFDLRHFAFLTGDFRIGVIGEQKQTSRVLNLRVAGPGRRPWTAAIGNC
jgi:hypothetical protein